MPVTTPGIFGAVYPNLVSVGVLGSDGPKLARGIANGLVRWIPQVRVSTTDAGSAGVGSNVPLPLIIPAPLLYPALAAGMAAQGLLGIFVPVYLVGLSNGLSLAFTQMLVKTTHPGVGTGAGVAKFSAPPAASSMRQGFFEAGLKGESFTKKATAVAMGLDIVFASLVLPVIIVGSASPSPGTGVGSGSIM